MISVYSKKGDDVSCFELFSSMQKEGVGSSFKPNEYTFGSLTAVACSLVHSCSSLREQMVVRVEKSGFVQDLYLCSAFASGFARLGLINFAKRIFEQMSDRNMVSMNGLTGDKAVRAFLEMTDLVGSNCDSYAILLSAIADFPLTQEGRKKGREVHVFLVRNSLIDTNVTIGNGLVNMYAKCGAIDDACLIFGFMVSWNSEIGAFYDTETQVSEAIEVTLINALAATTSLSLHGLGCQLHGLSLKHCPAVDMAIESALLSCYGRCGEMEECEKIFLRMCMRRDDMSWNSMISGYIHNDFLTKAKDMNGQRLDSFIFATVLSACASVATLEHDMEVHACEIRTCLESDVVVGSALVDMYAKYSRIDNASRFFELMPLRNVYSWNMISSYARHGHGEEDLNLFKWMKFEGPHPDHVTFVCQLVAMLAWWRKVEDFINTVPVEPNVSDMENSFRCCLSCERLQQRISKKAAKMLLELEPRNAVDHGLLANMYASGGKGEDVAMA
ncbi:Pentatricopeptide repeat [Dillenia turbinata]|uniref:Pentatricopeptide repeat n=1 Tax=Dillenia turbinata TaxID=194707 RepID=A0AAN8YZV1_9MAGN